MVCSSRGAIEPGRASSRSGGWHPTPVGDERGAPNRRAEPAAIPVPSGSVEAAWTQLIVPKFRWECVRIEGGTLSRFGIGVGAPCLGSLTKRAAEGQGRRFQRQAQRPHDELNKLGSRILSIRRRKKGPGPVTPPGALPPDRVMPPATRETPRPTKRSRQAARPIRRACECRSPRCRRPRLQPIVAWQIEIRLGGVSGHIALLFFVRTTLHSGGFIKVSRPNAPTR
jgi:hypothetical protein